jgi:hypothetical protein
VLTFDSPQCHLVSTFTRVLTVIFSAFSTHHTQSTTRAVRLCRAPRRRVHDVTRTRAGVADITLWGCPVAPAAIFAQRHAGPRDGRVRKGGKGEILWAHTYPKVSSRRRGRYVRSLVPIGSEMWICIRCKQTYKQTFIFMYKIIPCIFRNRNRLHKK